MSEVTITYLVEPSAAQLRMIVGLYRQAGWWPETEAEDYDRLARLVRQSHCFAVGVSGETIVAMGRAISDGVSDAYLQDVTVDPAWRGRGVATRIVDAILARLQADAIAWVALIAERGSAPFYGRFGFEVMANATPMLRIG